MLFIMEQRVLDRSVKELIILHKLQQEYLKHMDFKQLQLNRNILYSLILLLLQIVKPKNYAKFFRKTKLISNLLMIKK